MKWSRYLLPTLRENPADAVIASHQLMMRAGMVRKAGSGLYLYLPYGLKLLKNIEGIIRDEMDGAGALEITSPLLISKKLLNRSGRWEVFQKELFRLTDRNEVEMALSPTNEENFTELVKQELSSYRQFPINLYQINDKFRDEIRPRYGVMRGKEFIMKDAYSFDLDDESLDVSYQAMKEAYIRIFNRVGLNFIPVKADSGAMGGSGSEEFMVKSEVGEETIVHCQCGYVANLETADELLFADHESQESEITQNGSPVIQEVETPGQSTIEKVCAFLNKDVTHSIKIRVYSLTNLNDGQKRLLAVLIRGDYEVNDTKLAKQFPDCDIDLATEKMIEKAFNSPPGYLGAKDIPSNVELLVDESLSRLQDGIMGANRKDYHLVGVDLERDVFVGREVKFHNLYVAKVGGRCPVDGSPLEHFKGIEVGHIFKLGRKYSDAFEIVIVNDQGKKVVPTMGCYGIGVNRLLAAIIEQHHDDRGVLLPYNLAPFQVLIISLGVDKEVVYEQSEKLYQELQAKKLKVLWDDRKESPGSKFSDADLTGMPIQVVIGEKGIKGDQIELRVREKSGGRKSGECKIVVKMAEVVEKVQELHYELSGE